VRENRARRRVDLGEDREVLVVTPSFRMLSGDGEGKRPLRSFLALRGLQFKTLSIIVISVVYSTIA